VLAAFQQPSGEGEVARRRPTIDRLFDQDKVEDILAACDREAASHMEHAGFAGSTAAAIRAKSPLSLKIALTQMRLGTALDFEDCMRTEFRVVSRVIRGHDFYEGVRAVIVDKDNAAVWQPATLGEISDADVARHFAPLPGSELTL
jgi:enoyl-CoA hydratase